MTEQGSTQDSGKTSNIQATLTILNPKGPEAPSDDGTPKKLKMVLTVVKSLKEASWLAWLVVIIVLVVVFQQPVKEAFSRATKLSVGSFSMEIERASIIVGKPGLSDVISGLSPRALELLLQTGKDSNFTFYGKSDSGMIFASIPNDSEMKAIMELKNSGLLDFRGKPFDEYRRSLEEIGLRERARTATKILYDFTRPLNEEEKTWVTYEAYHLTDLGKEAFDLVIGVFLSKMDASK